MTWRVVLGPGHQMVKKDPMQANPMQESSEGGPTVRGQLSALTVGLNVGGVEWHAQAMNPTPRRTDDREAAPLSGGSGVRWSNESLHGLKGGEVAG